MQPRHAAGAGDHPAPGGTRRRVQRADAAHVVASIGQVDAVLLSEVYPAGEAPIVAADGRALARALRVAGQVEPVFVDDIKEMGQAILDNSQDGDVVLCMGAGTIGSVPARVVELAAAAGTAAQEARA